MNIELNHFRIEITVKKKMDWISGTENNGLSVIKSTLKINGWR